MGHCRNMENRVDKDIDRPIMLVLLFGMLASIVFIFVGLVLLILHPEESTFSVLPVKKAIIQALKFQASGWLSLGLFTLILTPVARVLMAILSFAWIKDRKYALVSIVVFVAMMSGVFLNKF